MSADKLGALAIKEAVYKSKLKSDDIDEVIMGHVLTSGLGPIKVVNLALEKAEWKRDGIDLFEINEALLELEILKFLKRL